MLDEPTTNCCRGCGTRWWRCCGGSPPSAWIVVAVIHQPSDRALGDFDEVLLVRKGGKPAYYGPREGAWEALGGGDPGEGQSVAEALVWKAENPR